MLKKLFLINVNTNMCMFHLHTIICLQALCVFYYNKTCYNAFIANITLRSTCASLTPQLTVQSLHSQVRERFPRNLSHRTARRSRKFRWANACQKRFHPTVTGTCSSINPRPLTLNLIITFPEAPASVSMLAETLCPPTPNIIFSKF